MAREAGNGSLCPGQQWGQWKLGDSITKEEEEDGYWQMTRNLCLKTPILQSHLGMRSYPWSSLGLSLLLCKMKGFALVEINEDYPNEKKQAVYSELAIAKDQPLITCTWQRPKGMKGLRKLYDEKKKSESFRYALTGSCQHGKTGGGLSRSRISYVIGLGSIFAFLWLVLSWKWGQRIGGK